MAYFKASCYKIEIDAGDDNFVEILGLQSIGYGGSRSIHSSSDFIGLIYERVAGVGSRSHNISLSGVSLDDDGQDLVESNIIIGSAPAFRITCPDGNQYTGVAYLTNLSRGGGQSGSESFSCSLIFIVASHAVVDSPCAEGGGEEPPELNGYIDLVVTHLGGTPGGIIDLDGERGFWKFDELSGTVADNYTKTTINDNGTYINAPTLGASGVLAGVTSVTLDGVSDYIEMNDEWSTLWAYGNHHTLEVWVKLDSMGGQQSVWSATGLYYRGQEIYFDEHEFVFWGMSSEEEYEIRADASIAADGDWHHYVIVWDGTWDSDQFVRVYIDGVVKATANFIDASSFYADSKAVLGVSTSFNYSTEIREYNSRWLKGGLNLLAIYASSLTAEQIEDHFDASEYGVRHVFPLAADVVFDDNAASYNAEIEVTGITGTITAVYLQLAMDSDDLNSTLCYLVPPHDFSYAQQLFPAGNIEVGETALEDVFFKDGELLLGINTNPPHRGPTQGGIRVRPSGSMAGTLFGSNPGNGTWLINVGLLSDGSGTIYAPGSTASWGTANGTKLIIVTES